MTAEVYAEYFPSYDNVSDSQGSMTVMDTSVFVGWGASPYYSEYSLNGTLIQDVAFGSSASTSVESYRAYKFAWTGQPLTVPDLGVSNSSVYASWNGATTVSSWSLMAGTSATNLTSVSNTTRSGFETELSGLASNTYVAVAALGEDGSCLAVSTVWSTASSAFTSTAGPCPNGTTIATSETSWVSGASGTSDSAATASAATQAATSTATPTSSSSSTSSTSGAAAGVKGSLVALLAVAGVFVALC